MMLQEVDHFDADGDSGPVPHVASSQSDKINLALTIKENKPIFWLGATSILMIVSPIKLQIDELLS